MLAKKRLLQLFFLLLLCSCYKVPERNCKKFKTGKFEFQTFLKGELTTTHFTRTNTLEIDFFKNKADTSSVRWINECECILKKINPKNRNEQKALHLKILTTVNDTYNFEYGIVGSNKKEQGTAKKIN